MTIFDPFTIENWSLKRIFSVALIVHLITAIFSEGFFQFDEHFQIIEFLGHKLNGTNASDLPWEYKEQIRPWFQVFVYYLLLAPLKLIGFSSPFMQVTILRILTSLFSLYSIYSLRDYFKENVNKQRIYLLCLLFAWFIPVIHARASSENLSAAFVILGFSHLMKSLQEESFLKGIYAGLLLGMAYLVKSQLAVAVAFLWFWLVLFHPRKWRTSLSIVLSVLIVIAIGVVIDFWGYGNWTFSVWNYFKINILENRVSSFGVDPWWYYLKLSFMKGIPLVSLPFILGSFYFWYKNWKHPITWLTAPFFLIHCGIGHKELRFIFLVVLLSPFMMATALSDLDQLKSRWFKYFIFLNLIILIPAGFRSANSAIRFYKHIKENNITSFKAHGEDPFRMVGLKMGFYYPKNLKIDVFKDSPSTSGGYIFFKSGKKFFEYSKNKKCKLDYLSYPRWSLNFNIGNWIERSRVWSLWKCTN